LLGFSARKFKFDFINIRSNMQFSGHLRGEPDEMFGKIREAFARDPITSMLLEGDQGDVNLVLLPAEKAEPKPWRVNWPLHWLLFFATVATTTWAGALDAGVNLLQQPERFAVGLPYSLALLLILGSHELGHYFTARAHGIRVTPPYFIPVPFALGTFGAFVALSRREISIESTSAGGSDLTNPLLPPVSPGAAHISSYPGGMAPKPCVLPLRHAVQAPLPLARHPLRSNTPPSQSESEFGLQSGTGRPSKIAAKQIKELRQLW